MLLREAIQVDYAHGQREHDRSVGGGGPLGLRARFCLSAAPRATCLLPGNDAGMHRLRDERVSSRLWESGIGSDVMKPIAAPIVGGMITSTIHVLILVPVFFLLMKKRALRRGELRVHTESELETAATR